MGNFNVELTEIKSLRNLHILGTWVGLLKRLASVEDSFDLSIGQMRVLTSLTQVKLFFHSQLVSYLRRND